MQTKIVSCIFIDIRDIYAPSRLLILTHFLAFLLLLFLVFVLREPVVERGARLEDVVEAAVLVAGRFGDVADVEEVDA